jgi:hypothetical protein
MENAMQDAKYLEVRAGVRYWEDGVVDGIEDSQGKIALRVGDDWKPVIDLDKGRVLDWPTGSSAAVHYKVCDDGDYWLQNEDGRRIAKWRDHYVPSQFLTIGTTGSDYIVLRIDGDGFIADWRRAPIKEDQWEPIPSAL